ncbi:glycosyltransferase [Candidatus Woesearchaeota archaeon]|nr:glycosyltransferase [Candidatus Woesearchaeota archaeon]
MKVMHLITGLGTGGAERQLLNILPQLKGEKKGIPVHYLHYQGWNFFSVLLRFYHLVKKEKPDILNTYLIHADLFGRVFGNFFGIPIIICSVRNKLLKRRFLLFLDKMTSFLVTKYTPNSYAVKDFLVQTISLPESKMVVIPNGIDLSLFQKKKDLKKKRKELSITTKYIIICVASFKPQKDHATLLRAFSQLKGDITLLLVGEGEEKTKMQNLAKDLGCAEKTIFLGKRDDVPELLSLSDIFVLPSLHEGMSNALLEAMASHCAIIASDIPENRELVRNKKEALLFSPGNAEELTSGMHNLLSSSSLREKLGKAAFSQVKKYSFDRVVSQLEQLYKDLKRD